MNPQLSIKLKAVFLLIVFSMNTVVGFACAMGVDMGFNSKHHHDDEEATETSVPVNGKEHQQHDEANKHHHYADEATEITIHVHLDGKKHNHHNEAAKHHNDAKEDSEKDGCCNDGVIKLQNLEKNLNLNNNPAIYTQLFATIVSTLWSINIFKCAKVFPQHYKPRVFHPPAPDILIAIQRFQI